MWMTMRICCFILVEQLRTDYQHADCSVSMAATQMVTEFKAGPCYYFRWSLWDGMDGYTLVRTIRSMDQFRTIAGYFPLRTCHHDSFVQERFSKRCRLYTSPTGIHRGSTTNRKFPGAFQREERLFVTPMYWYHEAEKEHELVRQVKNSFYRHIGNHAALTRNAGGCAAHQQRLPYTVTGKKVDFGDGGGGVGGRQLL